MSKKNYTPSSVSLFKTIFLTCAIFVFGKISAQTSTIYFQTFDSSYTEWTLNSSAESGVTGATKNYWYVSNDYAGDDLLFVTTPDEPAGVVGGPESNYMHITATYANNDGYYEALALVPQTGNKVASMNTPIVTTGYSNVTLSFYYVCDGGTNYYGQLYYSLNGGTSWVLEGTDYKTGQKTSWAPQVTITDPAWSNVPSLEFAFVWYQGGGSADKDPALGIDDIKLVGVLSNPCAVVITSQDSTNPTCGSPNAGTIHLAATDTTTGAVLTYHISNGVLADSNGTGSFTGLAAGTYTISVSDQHCTTTGANIILSLPAGPGLVTSGVVITQPTCGGSNGSITGLSATGGATPYTSEIWKNGSGTTVSTTYSLSNEPGGTYTFTITDHNGCTHDTSFTLATTSGPKLVTTNAQVSEPTCGQSNGSILLLSAQGGATPYTEIWKNSSGTTVSSSFNLSGVAAGTYTLTVYDNAGCTTDTSFTLTSSGGATLVTNGLVITQPSCGQSNGSVSGLSATGGAMPYQSEIWKNSSGNTISNTYNFGSQPAGTYTFTLTDNAGCTTDTSITLASASAPKLVTSSFVINEPSCGQSNGSASGLSAAGGATPYQSEIWTNSSGTVISNTYNFSNQPAGTDTFTLTDNAGCTVDTIITLTAISGPQLVTNGLVVTAPTCGQPNGSVTGLNASGGNGPYTETWKNSGSNTTVSDSFGFVNQGAGTYLFTLTDNSGCSIDTSITIDSVQSPYLITNALTISAPACGEANGSVSGLNGGGGTQPYTELWVRNDTIISTSFNFSNEPSGTYQFSLTDNSGCTADTTLYLTSPGAPVLVTDSFHIQQPACGQQTGGVTGLSATGGQQPYTETWKNSSNTVVSDSFNFSGQPGGTYNFTLTDQAGCSAYTSVTLTATGAATPPTIAASDSSICPGDSSQICVTNQTYSTYSWQNGSSASCIYASVPGNYYVTVTDDNGCTAASSHLKIAAFQSPSVSTSVKGDTIECYNAVTYQWYDNDTLIPSATDSIYIARTPGSYTVLITDTNSCSAISNPIPIDTITSINGVRVNIQFELFPNPVTTGVLELRNPATLIGTPFRIYDATGRLLLSSAIRNEQSEIDISSFASGTYLFKIGDAVQKFVKQ